MNLLAEAIGITALVPAMAGPISLPEAEGGPAELIVALCQGGSFVIPVNNDGAPAAPATICCAKGCHRRDKRGNVDPEQ